MLYLDLEVNRILTFCLHFRDVSGREISNPPIFLTVRSRPTIQPSDSARSLARFGACDVRQDFSFPQAASTFPAIQGKARHLRLVTENEPT